MKRLPCNFKLVGSLGNVTTSFFQNLDYYATLKIFNSVPQGLCCFYCFFNSFFFYATCFFWAINFFNKINGQMAYIYFAMTGNSHRSLNSVLNFAYIPRPIISLKKFFNFICYAYDFFTKFMVVVANKMFNI